MALRRRKKKHRYKTKQKIMAQKTNSCSLLWMLMMTTMKPKDKNKI